MKAAIAWSALAILSLASSLSAQKPEIVVQTGHTDPINSVAFSPDGRTLASGSWDTTIKLWDVTGRRVLRTLSGHTAEVYSVAFSPDGRTLASGSEDKTIKLWDVASGRELRSMNDQTYGVRSVAFSPDGRTLASASSEIMLWEVASGRALHALAGAGPVAFSPDGRTLASGGWDDTIKLWDVARGRQLGSLGRQTKDLNSLAFSPDGRNLASAGWDPTINHIRIKLWEVTTGSESQSLVGAGPLAFSPDGRILASGGSDVNAIKLWDVASGRELHSLASNSMIYALAFSPDGRTLASTNQDVTIKLWDVPNWGELRSLGGQTDRVRDVAFAPDERTLALGSSEIKLWNLASGYSLQSPGGAAPLAFSSDGRILASSGSDRNTIKLWEVASGRELRSLDAKTVSSLAFSPDGGTLAAGSDQNMVKLWDATSGRELRTLVGHTDPVESLAFSHDGGILASGSEGGIKLWDVASGRELRSLHCLLVNSLAFSPDGGTLAAASGESLLEDDSYFYGHEGPPDKTIKLWDVASGRELRRLTGHTDMTYSVAFSPDGRILASGGMVGRIKFWDVTTGRETRTLTGHTNTVGALAVSSDSRWLFSGSNDGTARVWEADTGEPAATLVTLKDSTDWLVVTPDGLFDGSPAAWNQILWRFNNNTFDVAPVEIFFREYYYPGLLADILAGKHPRATTDIANIDRRQPVVAIERTDSKLANQAEQSRTIKLRLQISDAPPDAQHKDRSGARDVRLFRNGALVKVWRGDLKLDSQGHAQLEAELPLVAGENRFTAYAFSKSDIKSSDAPLSITGADSLKRDGIGYILAIGVNEYANKDYNLKYAVADVNDFASVFCEQQRKLQNYVTLKITYLLNSDATKANILGALERLAGGSADKFTPAQQKLFADLAPAQPEDGVFIYYAGHGHAVGQRFYLLPHDAVVPDRSEDLAKPEAHTVSDLELGDIFEKIGAGRSLLVIDACRSGQALEAEEKRCGPMNSKGLAQLAYEKGMYILTASQGYQSALESAELGGGHGFLTYALVEKGLKTRDAAVDGQVDLRHWLDFATQLVPQLQLASMQKAQKQGRGFAIIDGEAKQIAFPEQRSLQRPRVFYRREPESQPFIVAKP